MKPKDLADRIQAALKNTNRVILARVRSRSNPKIRHPIKIAADHTVYCECDGWRWSKKSPKTCHHLEKFKAAVRPQEL